MPPARAARRVVNDENAENTTRVTRAKAAALDTAAVGEPPKKALAAKRTNATNGTLGARKRTALVDVSNVAKDKPVVNGDKKETLAKATLATTAKPAGIQKPSARTGSTRSTLSAKSANTTSGPKRPASGSGVTGTTTKKRNTITKPERTEDEYEDEEALENVPPTKNEASAPAKASKVKAPAFARDPVVVDDDEDDEEAESWEELIKEAKDLDTEDLDDPLMVAEYVHEIFDYMKEVEISTMPNPDYMSKQGELEWKMRGILVDWLLEVHLRFRLLPETLFLAVNIIDRFLSNKVVQLDRLQLVGVTALFIASKYEEVLSPHVTNFVHVAEDGFSEQEILSAERFVLATLDFDLSYPNPMNFLRRISKADNYDIQTRTLGKYLLEIGCLDHRFLKYPPSLVAAAAMYVARLALDRGGWDATLSKYAGYTETEIQPVFKLMVEYLYSPVIHEAFFRKYASKKFLKASLVLRQWAKKWAINYLDDDVLCEIAESRNQRS